MAEQSSKDQKIRQILVCVGNRYVIFGREHVPPGKLKFSPNKFQPLQRIADESEMLEQRIIQTVQVSDGEISNRGMGNAEFDFELEDTNGHTFIDIKVREGEFVDRDYKRIFNQLLSNKTYLTKRFEIWLLNTQRLKLQILSADNNNKINRIDFVALDVWEYNSDGTIFDKSHVSKRVKDWVSRIEALYTTIESSVAKTQNLRTDRSRAISMSEELMQKFSVPDQQLPVLDISNGRDPIVSFIPFGLWIIGANGRINVITHSGTQVLVGRGIEERPEWGISDVNDRTNIVPFDATVFVKTVRNS